MENKNTSLLVANNSQDIFMSLKGFYNKNVNAPLKNFYISIEEFVETPEKSEELIRKKYSEKIKDNKLLLVYCTYRDFILVKEMICDEFKHCHCQLDISKEYDLKEQTFLIAFNERTE